MQDSNDKFTADLLGKKRRGRPATGRALTPAQYKAAQRARDLEAAPSGMTVSGLQEAIRRAVAQRSLVDFDVYTAALRQRLE